MPVKFLKTFRLFSLLFMFHESYCQDNNRMDIESYNPKSTLVVSEHLLTRAKFPFIDVHNHQWNMPEQDLTLLLQQMDSLNLIVKDGEPMGWCPISPKEKLVRLENSRLFKSIDDTPV